MRPGEIKINYRSVSEITEEMAQVVSLYAGTSPREMDSGAQQQINGLSPLTANRQDVPAAQPAPQTAGFMLATSRSLYTSYEAAAVHSPDADRLHREDSVRINPADAAALGLTEGELVTLSNPRGRLTAKVNLTEAVQPRMLYLPLYFDGGAVLELLDSEGRVVPVELSKA